MNYNYTPNSIAVEPFRWTFQETLGGQCCVGAGRFGAIGAEEANKRVIFNRTATGLCWKLGTLVTLVGQNDIFCRKITHVKDDRI